MAELCVGAPLASADTEEDWNDFSESVSNSLVSTEREERISACEKLSALDISVMDSFLERGRSSSLEDLVNTFDKKLSECFCNDYEGNVAELAPQQTRSHEDIVNGCQTWLTLTGNYGNALPIDWSKCYIRELQTKALHLDDNQLTSSAVDNLDLSDDEELAEAFDVHKIISPMVPRLHEDEDIDVEDVIDEIDTIMKMQDSMNTEDTGYMTEPDMLASMISSADSDNIHFKSPASPISKVPMSQDVKELTTKQLNEMVDELQTEIDVHSQLLVHELAARDDIVYEQELKNTFISLSHKVMSKQRNSDSKDKKRKATECVTSASGMTYVIPYQLTQMPPSNDLLQVYIKILKAIYEDSPAVPSMLTDYILKVVCPTS